MGPCREPASTSGHMERVGDGTEGVDLLTVEGGGTIKGTKGEEEPASPFPGWAEAGMKPDGVDLSNTGDGTGTAGKDEPSLAVDATVLEVEVGAGMETPPELLHLAKVSLARRPKEIA